MPKKHSYEYIKEIIESNKLYKLISKEYKNAREKLEIQCSNNHIFYMSYDNFIRGHDCKFCADERRKKPFCTYEEVKQYIEIDSNSKCILLSKKYTGVNQKLELKCSCGENFITDFHNFKLGKIRCNKCNGMTNWNYMLVKGYLEENDYKLISTEYIKANLKLEMKCPNNHFCKMSLNDFQQGTRCSTCAGNKKHSIDEVRDMIQRESNYKLISDEYINLTGELLVKCDKGHIYQTSLASFKQGCRCKICSMSLGEKSIENWLIDNKFYFIPQYRFDDCKYINTLPFDFAVFNSKNNLTCLIEYDGEQHFKSIEYFGGIKNLELTKVRDEIKNNYCKYNNIVLIRIPYWEKNNISNILDDKLLLYGLLE